MKSKKKFIFSIFLYFFLLIQAFPQQSPKGIALSDYIYSELKTNKLPSHTQSLVNSFENIFPYNIILSFPSAKEDTKEKLIFIFDQEDFYSHKEELIEFSKFLQYSDFDFESEILFVYGQKTKIKKENMVQGLSAYITSLDTSLNLTAFYIDLKASKNSLDTSSNNIIAPSYLIQNQLNVFLDSDLDIKCNTIYLSQLHRLKYFYRAELSELFRNEIPALGINLKENINKEIILEFLKATTLSYSKSTNKNWDQHFIILNLPGKVIRISEFYIVVIIIFITFFWLLFLLILAFINSRIGLETWKSIRNIWISLPGTFLIVLFTSFLTRVLCSIAFQKISAIAQIYLLLGLQLLLPFIAVSVFYTLIFIYKFGIKSRSIDFIIVISTFLNQFIFSFIDISLFPVFMIICILSIVSMVAKKDYIHYLLFILMILPFIPYIHDFIYSENPEIIRDYFYKNPYEIFILPYILTPILLMYLRIFSSNQYFLRIDSKKWIFSSVASGLITLMLINILVPEYKKLKKNYSEYIKKSPEIIYALNTGNKNLISINYQDKFVFGELIRNLSVETQKDESQISVRVYSDISNPILYSDDDFEVINKQTSEFLIPENPPKKLNFSYGPNKAKQIIIVQLYYMEQDAIYCITKTIATKEY